MKEEVRSVYIHVPFCYNKCPYCDFYSVSTISDDLLKKYTEALICEIEFNKNMLSPKLASIYFGGGSPITLGTTNLELIMQKFSKYINSNTEITIEMNPEHLENKAVQQLLNIGFNRFSIGVQTSSSVILSLIERTSANLDNLFKLRKSSNFSISLDFMFGLPTQTMALFKQDLKYIVGKDPDHVSLYLFTPPKEYSYTHLCPEEDIIVEMFSTSHQLLKEALFHQYEVSNYSKQKKASIHNTCYWTRESYLGLGAAAHSFFKSKETRKWHDPDYLSYIASPTTYSSEETLNSDKIIEEQVMLGLRLLDVGVPVELLNESTYIPLLQNKMLKLINKNIVVEPAYIANLDSIILSLLS